MSFVKKLSRRILEYYRRVYFLVRNLIMKPAYHTILRLLQLSKKILRIVGSRNYRKLRVLRRTADGRSRAGDYGQAAKLLQQGIALMGNKTPADLRVQLLNCMALAGDYDAAEQYIHQRQAEIIDGAPGSLHRKQLDEMLALSNEKANISIKKRLAKPDDYKKLIDRYNKAEQKRSKQAGYRDLRVAVFSAVSGGYDSVKPPEVLHDGIDHVFYTDQPVESVGIYDIRPLPYFDADPTRSARYVKTHPHTLLADEYDVVIWIDANIMITGDITEIVDSVIDSGKSFGAMRHPSRQSVYDEFDVCIRRGKDDVGTLKAQKRLYKERGYDNDDLIESNILVYDLRDESLYEFLNDWWNQINIYSRRDQLSINYCLDNNEIDWHAFTNYPRTARDHPSVALTQHGESVSSLRDLGRAVGASLVEPFRGESYREARQEELLSGYRIDAIVCVHNAYEAVEKCLRSIEQHKTQALSLIIVDDGSADKTKRLLEKFNKDKPWVKLIRHDQAKGYTRAANAGLRASTADLRILLNSDTVVTARWHEKMAQAAINTKTGIVGPMSSAASTQSLPDYKSTIDQTAINPLPKNTSIDDMNDYCEEWAQANVAPIVPLVHGFCIGITKEVIDAIGYYDEEAFPRGYGEENDYCFRAADAGFPLAIATNTYVFHEKSKSFLSDDRKKLMQAGARAFRDKHGQRRIDRAVKTMQSNTVLETMRRRANHLYATKEIETPRKNETFVQADIPGYESMTYQEMVGVLTRYNDGLSWQRNKRQKDTVSIIVLVYNNLDLTLRCLESIKSAKNDVVFELLVVSNGSDLQTVSGLREYHAKGDWFRLILIEHNLNFAVGNNVGFVHSSGDSVVFLNNDTIVTDYWLDELMVATEDESIVAAQPTLYYPDNTIQCVGIGFSPRSSLGHAMYAHGAPRHAKNMHGRKLQAVTGACMLVRARDFQKVKGFSPQYINGQEDIDLSLRLIALKKDAYVTCIASSKVIHDESKTPGRGRYIMQNREVFNDQWSGKVTPDAEEMYIDDGYDVIKWRPDIGDTESSRRQPLSIYTPELRRRLFRR